MMVEPANQTNETVVRHLVVIGLGLIGGSLAKAARLRKSCKDVWGVAHNQEVGDRAIALGIVDQAATDITEFAPKLGAGDVIFIAVPTLAVKSVFEQIKACVPPEVTITDGASVKGSVLKDVRDVFGSTPAQVVLGHPIAGSEKSGVEAADPELYVKHRIILTPTAETGADHLQRVTALWQSVGAEVLHLDVAEHDEILGATSHLPHAIAFSLVDTLAHDSQNQNIFRYAAGGFRDFTRIASSDAIMWRDIMLANDQAILKAIDLFSANLLRLRTAVEQHDEQALLGIFTRAKAARDHFSKMLARKTYTVAKTSEDWDLIVAPSSGLRGSVQVPGDKSISHRSVMLGAIAEGITTIEGFLESEDALATIQALRDMGVVIEGPLEGEVTVHGVGLHGLQKPSGPIYVGNAGTSIRLLTGILAAQPFDSEIFGDDSLNARPMARIAEPLTVMGASVSATANGRPPLIIKGGRKLIGIDYRLPVASAQVKSCLLLAGLYANGQTRIAEPSTTRDHTERLLEGFGCQVKRSGEWLSVTGGAKLKGGHIQIPGDFSSAAFFIVAATICPGSDLTLTHVGVNTTRTGALEILRSMGADIELTHVRQVSGEQVADIRVKHAPLRGVRIPMESVSVAIDEFPALLVAAACANGTTELSGAEELRMKESDRIQAMAEGLGRLGISSTTTSDGIVVRGGQLSGGEVDSHGDHRVAMAFAIAGVRALAPVTITHCASVVTSFPNFTHLAKLVGMNIEQNDQ